VKSKSKGCEGGAVFAAGERSPERAPSCSRLLFYFNGFNSAIPADWSDNAKIVAVERYAACHGYDFHPTTINYRYAERQAGEIVQQLCSSWPRSPDPPVQVVFAGSSMGGWFARILQLRLAARRPDWPIVALAFNPAFDLARHGHLLVGPQVNFVTGEAYDWTAQDSSALGELEFSVDFDAPWPYFVYVDRDDEVIDWKMSAERLGPIAHFRAFEGGSHHFDHAGEALADFHAAACPLRPGQDARAGNSGR